jgi:hypothetical protein
MEADELDPQPSRRRGVHSNFRILGDAQRALGLLRIGQERQRLGTGYQVDRGRDSAQDYCIGLALWWYE